MRTLGRDPYTLVGRLLAAGALVVAVACGGGGGDDEASTDETDETTETTAGTGAESTASTAAAGEAAAPADVSWVVSATVPEIQVYAEPGGTGEPIHTLANPNENQAPLVFLATTPEQPTGEWVEVLLPVRPNGSTGFVRMSEVSLQQHDYRIRVELGAHRLVVTQGGRPVIETQIGVGTTDTPTPGGTYFVKELLQPPDPNGPYGTYAYGLSGYSNELTSFAGGDGVIGIHGTNEPESIGTDVSHGCIRLTNDVVSEMASFVPLGTPVEIVA